MEQYEVLKFFGSNIVVTEFDEWKRHRKIVAPAFSEVRNHWWTRCHLEDVLNDCLQKNNKLAFEESVRAITSLYHGGWRDKQEIVVDEVLHFTMAVSSAMRLLAGGDPNRPLRRPS